MGAASFRSSAETAIAERYRRFASVEARGRSQLYEELAEGVAGDRRTLAFLAGMPTAKQQPNLLFAAVRHVYGTPAGWAEFRQALAADGEEIAAVMRSRRTQTNEPARCATLLPALAMLRQPLALLEVGAAAGLCMLPDYYGYDFDGRVVQPSAHADRDPPVFRCRMDGCVPVPSQNVQIAWRRGLDIEPVDLHDEAAIRWLETLVWPGEEHRLVQLRAAIGLARQVGPEVERGDAAADLVALVDTAPPDATLVVFHSAVLPYLSAAGREGLARNRAQSALLACRREP